MEEVLCKPAEINQHLYLCIRFREESFIVSFHSKQGMREHMSKDGEKYIRWLKLLKCNNP